MAVTWINDQIANPPYASDEAVRVIERQFGVRFPADYLAVARAHQGAAPRPAGFDVEDFGRTAVQYLLHFEEKPPFSNIASRWEMAQDGLAEKVVPFAEEIGGDLVCLDFRENPDAPTVAFWSVDTGEVTIADSFTDFLTKLHGDEEE